MASTNALTTQTLVEKLIPGNYNSVTTVIDSTQWGVLIGEGSREAEAVLRVRYCPFNATTDTPPTPKPIQSIVSRLVGASALECVAPATFNSGYEETVIGWREWAEKKLDRLARGLDSLATETVTAEALTFGAGTEYALPTNMAFLAVAGQLSAASDAGEEQPTVVRESVRVSSANLTGYRLGVHFDVVFEPTFQKWCLVDHGGALRVHAAPAVTYRWSYERWNQAPQPGRVKSGRLTFV